VEDDVTIYAGATVLGGDTVLGRGSVIGGATFLTASVPPGSRVALDPPKLRIGAPASPEPSGAPDFDI
jgi:serine O-acetyltransferase